MEIVTTRDGQTVELRPCPPWCTGDHFQRDEVIQPDDGFHHSSNPIRIKTSDISNFFDGESTIIEMWVMAWTCPLDADPGPARIALQVLTAESADLTPTEARRVAEALIELSERITGPASGDPPEMALG